MLPTAGTNEGAEMICYACRQEMLPAIEATLAANGYAIDTLLQGIGGFSMVVMNCGESGAILTHHQSSEIGVIDIWGPRQITISRLIESLPLGVERRPRDDVEEL